MRPPARCAAVSALALLALLLLTSVGAATASGASLADVATRAAGSANASVLSARLLRAAGTTPCWTIRRSGTRPRPARGHERCRRPARFQRATQHLVRELGARQPTRDAVYGPVNFPSTLDGTVTLDAPESTGPVGWRMLGVPAAAADTFSSGVRFSTSEYDVLTSVTLSRAKESIVVYEHVGRRSWTWQLRGGSIQPFIAADGRVVLGPDAFIEPPVITTADGRKLREPRWRLNGMLLSLTLDDRNLPLPYVIDPTVDYSKVMCPTSSASGYVTGAEQVISSTGTCGGTADDSSLLLVAGAIGERRFNSLVNDNGTSWVAVTNSTPANDGAGSNNGSVGWVVDGSGLLGAGANLVPGFAGTWKVSAAMHTISGQQPTGGIKARLWKVTASAGVITASTPLSAWSAPSSTATIGNQPAVLTTFLTPTTSTVLGVNDHLYLELALVITGNSNSGTQVGLYVNHPGTFIDFGTPPTESTPPPGNLRDVTDTFAGSTHWLRTTTPTFTADLTDPDWYHHIRFRVCRDPDTSCASPVATGTTPTGSLPGATTNNSWRVPSALSDGIYYLSARTEEDTFDTDMSTWVMPSSGTLCSALPCSGTAGTKFGIDTGAPNVTITPPVPASGASNAVTGTFLDSLSGFGSYSVSYAGPMSGPACPSTPMSSQTTSTAWSCTWNTSGLIEGLYTLMVTAYDTAGNVATATGMTYIDNTAPNALAFVQFTPVSNASAQYASGSTLYINAGQSGSFTTVFTASDGASGIRRVSFPSLNANGASGFTGGPADGVLSPAAPAPPGPGPLSTTASFTYSWNAATGSPGTSTATAYDFAGLTNTGSFQVVPDATGPTGYTISHLNGQQSANTIPVSFTLGSDAGSGVSSWSIERRTATLSNGTCGAFPAWPGTQLGASNPTISPRNDTVAEGCYEYRMYAVDRVGNQSSFTSSSITKVDLTNPTATITTPAAAAYVRGTVAASGAANDAGSGVASATLAYSGPGGTGTACSPTLTAGGGGNNSWTCNWNTSSPLLADGSYTLTLTVTDAAGRIATATRTVTVDNTPPNISSVSWSESSTYLHAVGTRLWYNPTLAAGVPATLSATITDATLMQDVTFPSLSSPWTNPSPSVITGGGPTYSGTYKYALTAADPGTQQLTARDVSLNTSTASFDLDADGTAPSGMSVSTLGTVQMSASLALVYNPGTDGGSGMASAAITVESASLSGNTCGVFTTLTTLSVSATTAGTASYTVPSSGCYRAFITSTDNVGNAATSTTSATQKVDLGDPAVGWTSPADGTGVNGGAASLTGTAGDSETGISSVTITYAGPSTGTACTSATLAGGPTSYTWSCSWNSLSAADGTYTFTATSTDGAGRTATSTRTILVDNMPATINSISWTESSLYLHSSGTRLWYNPAQTGLAATLSVNATDAGGQVMDITFPTLPAPWGNPTPAVVPGTGTTFTGAGTYTWSSGGSDPSTQSVLVHDRGGNTTTGTFDIDADGAGPTGLTISQVSTITTGTATAINLGAGSDAGSGIKQWAVDYAIATYVGGACGSYGSWTSLDLDTATAGVQATQPGAAPSLVNVTANFPTSYCLKFRLLETDNVGNTSYSTESAARPFDRDDPTVSITAPTAGALIGGTFTITGSATDTDNGTTNGGSGLSSVTITYTQLTPTAGTANTISCSPVAVSGKVASWSCAWNTASLADGTYRITAIAYDLSGRQSTPSTVDVTVDNQPPIAAFHSVASGSAYSYWAGPNVTNTRIWFNPNAPAGSYNIDVTITASDGGTGISSVGFPAPGAGWNAGGNATSVSPPTSGYRYRYTFSGGSTAADPSTLNATAYDGSLNARQVSFDIDADTTGPAGGSITPPSGYQPSTSFSISLAGGTDSQSGIAGWTLERSSAALSGTTCGLFGGWTAIASGTGLPPATTTDNTPVDQNCYMYRLLVRDNVSNTTTLTSSNVSKIDMTPPSGSIVLAEGTNPDYQYLANPTRIYVNTRAGFSGNFTATASVTAASGILDVAFPDLGTGWTGASLDTAAPYVTTYGWTGGATTASPSMVNALARSITMTGTNLPFEVIADTAGPGGGSISYNNGMQSTLDVTITFVTGIDAGSGIRDWWIERAYTSLSNGTCGTFSTWAQWGATSLSSPVTDPLLASGFCYKYRLAQRDNVGNVSYVEVSNVTMTDATSPTSTSVTLTPLTNTQYQYVSGTTLYYNDGVGSSGTFRVDVTGVDAESGIGRVAFPGFGATWTSGSGPYTDSASPFQQTYGFSTASLEPQYVTAFVFNRVNLGASAGFTVLADHTPPASNGTIGYPSGIDMNDSIDVSFTYGTGDALSGILHRWIERRSVTYDDVAMTCGSFTNSWARTGTLSSYDPTPGTTTDTTVTPQNCYQWRLVESDRVGNLTIICSDGTACSNITTAIETRDVTPPSAFALNDPTSAALPAITTGQPAPSCASVPTYATATPTFTWTASTDSQSPMDRYDIYFDSTGAPVASNPFPPGSTSWTPASAIAEGPHSWGVRAYDAVGNARTSSGTFLHTFRIDTTAPTASLASPATGTFTNNTRPTLGWAASDSNCLARVIVHLNGATTAVASGSESSWTPSTALADGTYTWDVEAVDTVDNRGTSTSRTFTVDTAPPDAFAILTPADGSTFRGFVNVTWNAATDALSGIAGYNVYIDGVKRNATMLDPATLSLLAASLSNGSHTVWVEALDRAGNSTVTSTNTFFGYSAIQAPSLISPANLAKLNYVPTMQWSWAVDGGPTPTTYDVQIGSSVATLASVVTGVPYTAGVTSSLIPDPGDGTWVWRVVQHDPYTGTVNSTTRTFTIDRTPPGNVGPISRSATVLSWPAAVDPATPTATGINQMQVWIDDGTGYRLVAVLAATATSYDIAGLSLADGVYQVKLRAWDNTCPVGGTPSLINKCTTVGNFTDSPVYTLTMDAAPPAAFSLNVPVNPALPAITTGQPSPSCTATPTLSGVPNAILAWSASSDAVSGLDRYDVYLDGVVVSSVAPPATTYTSGMVASGGHTWRVRAYDVFGNSTWGAPSTVSLRWDNAAPTAAVTQPTSGSWTDRDPLVKWSASDDNCLARVEVVLDGSVAAKASGTETSWQAPVLVDGPHTVAIRAIDTLGNVTTSPAITFSVDTAGPTSVSAVNPTDASTVPEAYYGSATNNFEWTTGSDAGSGILSYDFWLDGTVREVNLTGTKALSTYPIYPGNHTWKVVARDNVGNTTAYNFSFTAYLVPDLTPPAAFDLLSPTDGSLTPSPALLTWQPSSDFKGIDHYEVWIDGAPSGTTNSSTTSMSVTPTTSGGPITGCGVTFDPSNVAGGCVYGASYATPWTVATRSLAPNSPSGGNSLGADAYDCSGCTISSTYTFSVPADGSDFKFAQHFNAQKVGDSAYDGGTLEIRFSNTGGSTWSPWRTTCNVGTTVSDSCGDAPGITSSGSTVVAGTKWTDTTVSPSVTYDFAIVEPVGGYNATLASGAGNQLGHQQVFSGTNTGMQQTNMHLSQWAGKLVQIRFRLGLDTCWTGMSASQKATCQTMQGAAPAAATWNLDDLQQSNPQLGVGLHSWFVRAYDPSGNMTQSNQTWTFLLS